MRTRLHLLSIACGFSALVACQQENEIVRTGYGTDPGDLTIKGRVCDAENHVWVPDATVYTHLIDPETGEMLGTIQSITDEDGWYLLEGIVGERDYTVYVQYGSALLDKFVIHVDSSDVEITPPAECGGGGDITAAVIQGDYDSFESILPDLGIADYQLVNGLTGDELAQFLTDGAGLADFDVIFFNGGHIEEDVFYDVDGTDTAGTVQAVRDTLKAYVDAGGTVFASDWSYDVIETTWPGKIDWHGEDTTPDAAQIGAAPATVNGKIVDGDLQATLGVAEVDVAYDLDAFPIADTVDETVTIYVQGEVPWLDGMEEGSNKGSPMLMSFASGDGLVIVSTWLFEGNAEGDVGNVARQMVAKIPTE